MRWALEGEWEMGTARFAMYATEQYDGCEQVRIGASAGGGVYPPSC